jgi:hypothetical protein
MSFFNGLSNPRLATLHGSDVLQLIATGMCFGVALATLVMFLRGRRSS